MDNQQTADSSVQEKPAEPLTILIAEDDLLNQRILEMLLHKIGHRSISANNGKEALERWQQGGIDAILMDIQMPVMDGDEALLAIRSREQQSGCHTPVIALSADNLKAAGERLPHVDYDAYLTKPVKSGELADELQRVMTLQGP